MELFVQFREQYRQTSKDIPGTALKNILILARPLKNYFNLKMRFNKDMLHP